MLGDKHCRQFENVVTCHLGKIETSNQSNIKHDFKEHLPKSDWLNVLQNTNVKETKWSRIVCFSYPNRDHYERAFVRTP